jgi:AcrR family transcriptional regulator
VPVLAGAPTEEGCEGDCDVCRSLRQAVLEALASEDLAPLEGPDVAARAGLTEVALVDHYGSVEACLAATYDELSEQLYALHVEAFDGPGDWRSRFVAGVRAAFGRIAATPGAARLLFAEELLADPRLRSRRVAARQRLALLVAEELEAERDQAVPAVQAEFLIGAASRAAQTGFASGAEPWRVAARVSETLRVLEPRAA